MMNAWCAVFSFYNRVTILKSRLDFLWVALFAFLLKIAFFCNNLRSIGFDRVIGAHDMRQNLVLNNNRAHCILGNLRGDSGDRGYWRSCEAKFRQRCLDHSLDAGNFRRCGEIKLLESRMSMRTAKDAAIEHIW